MKTSLKFFAALGLMLGLAACGKEDKPSEGPSKPDVETKVVANFTYEVNGLEVTFTNTSEGATTYKWDFGDGETSKEASPKHAYEGAGEYTVKLTAANADGVVNRKEQTLTIAGEVKAYFTFEVLEGRAGKFGKVIAFDATASENAESIAWDFGDGQTATEFKVNHEFPDYGKYTVKAVVKGGGAEDVYSAEIEAVANNELLKGGQMNEGDEQYWTISPIWADVADAEGKFDYVGDEGTYCWNPTFGYTDDKPKGGEGGCLRLSSENQAHDFANNFCMYQAIEVEKGDVLRVSAEMKWGENNNDNGLLWFGFSKTAPAPSAPDRSAVIEMYNYWNAAGVSVPAFDGNFATNEAWVKANAEMVLGYSGNGETPYAEYTVEETGTLYFYMDYRNVWGTTFGPGRDMYFDNFSVKVIL